MDRPRDGSPFRLGESLKAWMKSLTEPDSWGVPVPAPLDGVLRDYQATGFRWMRMLGKIGLGAILADDMGLGKTVQTIAFVLSLKQDGEDAPVLVVAPSSLVYNWAAEFRRFAPGLDVRVVAGTPDEREQILSAAASPDVWVTSYPLLRHDYDLLSRRTFAAIIFDEAQAIKNYATKTAQAAFRLQSQRRFALTGTPIENALDDVWSIFRVVSPDLLGSREEFLRLTPPQVARRIRPFVLRRLKKDVIAELPGKIESVQSVGLTRAQKAVYLSYLMRIQGEARADLEQTGFNKSRIKILAGLTRLRQICCDPGLFLEGYTGGSAKLEALLELVDEALASGRHILIFSQFTTMLGRIREALHARGQATLYLDGETPPVERLALVERFNAGEVRIFLASLKAGGTGLNLTGADMVILYDLWWNPAVEEQAVDRAHRIGQKKVVQVVRLIVEGTVEEKIHALQSSKKDLVDRVIGSETDGRLTLSEAEIREILDIAR
jgi:SNF2 family DNA or RNA helicase